MNNQITLNEETIIKLQELFIEIDEETNKPESEYNLDTVVSNQYEILDIVKKIVLG
jgi:hypothetical protein